MQVSEGDLLYKSWQSTQFLLHLAVLFASCHKLLLLLVKNLGKAGLLAD